MAKDDPEDGAPDGTEDGGKGRSIGETARDHVRAAAGGLLVGMPLLVTMEMWDTGSTIASAKLLVLLGLAFAVVVGYNAIAGFRRERSIPELLIDAAQGIGISVVIAASALLVLGRLEPELGFGVIVGRVGLLTIPVAFGTSLAASVLSEPEKGASEEPVGPIGRLIVAGGGAVYFALNVAPTDEVRILGSEAGWPLLLVAVGTSLMIGLIFVFEAGVSGGRGHDRGETPLQGPYGETIAAYAVALGVSAVLLWAFGLTDGVSLRGIVGEVVMLGIVASIGAATGRLLLGGSAGGSDAGDASAQAAPA